MNDPVTYLLAELAKRLAAQLPLDPLWLAEIETTTRSTYGGSEWYVRRKQQLTSEEKAERNNQIRREFNGQNLKLICRKYELGKSTLYRILRRDL